MVLQGYGSWKKSRMHSLRWTGFDVEAAEWLRGFIGDQQKKLSLARISERNSLETLANKCQHILGCLVCLFSRGKA